MPEQTLNPSYVPRTQAQDLKVLRAISLKCNYQEKQLSVSQALWEGRNLTS